MELNDLIEMSLSIHRSDAVEMRRLDNYARGIQAAPYGARGHSEEFRALAKRSVINWVGLAVSIPVQMSIIEGYRVREKSDPPEWEAFKGNRMDRKQMAFHEASGIYGHSFAEVVWPEPGMKANGVLCPPVRGLPTTRTVAIYDDPFGDRFPIFAIRFDANDPERATVWHGLDKMRIKFTSDDGETRTFKVEETAAHGFPVVPIVRWVVKQDLEGRTTGLVAPLIKPQDEVNQSKFDLSVTRNFSSYKIRTASGLEGEPLIDPRTGEQVIDEATGEPVFVAPEIGQDKFLVSEDENTKFGTLDETPLDGFIESLNQSVEHFAAVSQIPPHALQGRMANLSAEALVAAEEQLMRQVGSLQRSWGDSWATLFQLIAYAQGETDALYDFSGQVRWRDMRARSLGEQVDALGKGAQMLQIPPDALWKFFPGADAATIQEWRDRAAEMPPIEMTEQGNAVNLSRSLTGMANTSARRPDASVIPRRRAA